MKVIDISKFNTIIYPDISLIIKDNKNIRFDVNVLKQYDRIIEEGFWGPKVIKNIRDAEDAIALKYKSEDQIICFPLIVKDNDFLKIVAYDKEGEISFEVPYWLIEIGRIGGALLLGPEHGEALRELDPSDLKNNNKKGFIYIVNFEKIAEFLKKIEF